jgi:hypothetical protein
MLKVGEDTVKLTLQETVREIYKLVSSASQKRPVTGMSIDRILCLSETYPVRGSTGLISLQVGIVLPWLWLNYEIFPARFRGGTF